MERRAQHCAALSTGLLLGLLLLLAAPPAARAQLRVQLPCERITGIRNCAECMASNRRCVWCTDRHVPVWSSQGIMTSCRAATVGTTCTTASGDPNCARCDGRWCVLCRRGYQLNSSYRCVTGPVQFLTRTPGCGSVNPDGTCARCANVGTTRYYLVPQSAIYLNGPAPDARCLTLAQVQREALTLTGKPLSIHRYCVQVTPDFKCARCLDGWTLTTTNQCVSSTSTAANRCSASVRFRQYCSRCSSTGTACVACTWGRSLLNGVCALDCKRLYGIGCRACNSAYCTAVDPVYQNGR